MVVANRWVALCAAMALMTASGTSYAFGLYSDSLKNKLHYDEYQTQSLATAVSLG